MQTVFTTQLLYIDKHPYITEALLKALAIVNGRLIFLSKEAEVDFERRKREHNEAESSLF